MKRLVVPEDFRDLLLCLVEERAEFLVIGGWAMAVHGHGRATDDLDIFVRATEDNALRVFRSLERFGAPLIQHGVSPAAFAHPPDGYRFGHPPLLVEVLTEISGVSFSEALAGSIVAGVDGVEVPVIGRGALLANKRAAGRPKDMSDVAMLESLEDP